MICCQHPDVAVLVFTVLPVSQMQIKPYVDNTAAVTSYELLLNVRISVVIYHFRGSCNLSNVNI